MKKDKEYKALEQAIADTGVEIMAIVPSQTAEGKKDLIYCALLPGDEIPKEIMADGIPNYRPLIRNARRKIERERLHKPKHFTRMPKKT